MEQRGRVHADVDDVAVTAPAAECCAELGARVHPLWPLVLQESVEPPPWSAAGSVEAPPSMSCAPYHHHHQELELRLHHHHQLSSVANETPCPPSACAIHHEELGSVAKSTPSPPWAQAPPSMSCAPYHHRLAGGRQRATKRVATERVAGTTRRRERRQRVGALGKTRVPIRRPGVDQQAYDSGYTRGFHHSSIAVRNRVRLIIWSQTASIPVLAGSIPPVPQAQGLRLPLGKKLPTTVRARPREQLPTTGRARPTEQLLTPVRTLRATTNSCSGQTYRATANYC